MSFIDCRGSVAFYRLEGARLEGRGGAASGGAASGGAAESPLTLVFVNSLGTDHRLWDPLLLALPQALKARCTLLCYDQRGQGLSELGSEPHTVATLAADLAALLDALEIQQAVVCGLSLGGLVAQELAFRAPERVRALCLCATGLRIGTRESWQERIAVVRASGLGALAESVLGRWFTPAFRGERAAEARGFRTLLERNSLDGYVAALEALRDADLTAQASQIRAPALVLAGAADVATPPAHVQELAKALPAARFLSLEAAGHLVPVEQPAAVARALTGFLEEVGLV